jgi:hypothetical protein
MVRAFTLASGIIARAFPLARDKNCPRFLAFSVDSLVSEGESYLKWGVVERDTHGGLPH